MAFPGLRARAISRAAPCRPRAGQGAADGLDSFTVRQYASQTKQLTPRGHTMKRFAILLAALLAAGAVAGAANAQQTAGTLQKISSTGTITIGHRDVSIPFSYYDDKQQVVGYAIDICKGIVDAIKANLKMAKIDVKYNPVTSATRIPLMANGTIDLECGSPTNNLERQKQVAFTITHFVTANRYVAKKKSNIKTLNDLKGKTVVSTSGTTNIKWATEENAKRKLGMNT